MQFGDLLVILLIVATTGIKEIRRVAKGIKRRNPGQKNIPIYAAEARGDTGQKAFLYIFNNITAPEGAPYSVRGN